MNRYPIIEACARIEGHMVQHEMLRKYCCDFIDWEGLLKQAEKEGMTPLVKKHLEESGSEYPVTVRRSLNILYKRHQHQANMRINVLQKVLDLFHRSGLTPMVIKGAALCHTLYPESALRPMRDIDILFREEEVDCAQDLMRNAGFTKSGSPIPPDHYHLPSLHKVVDDVQICFELHRGLYPNCPPYYPDVEFEQLLATGKPFKIGSVEVVTFSDEETIHYLYQHGFRPPLTYESYKLINAADIIGFVEKNYHTLDWGTIKERYPKLHRALPLMHHITPWNFEKVSLDFISKRNRKRRLHPLSFNGWPLRRVKELMKKVTLGQVLKETFLPSSWWLRVYYGPGYSVWQFTKTICFDHPKNIFWWTHVYSHFVIETDTTSVNPRNSYMGALRLFFVSSRNKVRGVIRKILSL